MENVSFQLGGPGPGCSVTRLRQLAAGELSEPEALALRDHLNGCTRCLQTERELAHERDLLARDLPFPAFAATVAEKLAKTATPKRRVIWTYAAPLALAATLAAALMPLAIRRQANDFGTRTKGAAGASLLVQDGEGTRELGPGELVAPEARLALSLRPAGYGYVAAALVEPGPDARQISLLFAGPAKGGPQGSAFAWTGTGRASVVVWFSPKPITEEHFLSALRADRPDPHVAVVTVPLMR
jgi:hypothetical protein